MLSKNFKGNSLLETVIAMTIVIFVMLLTTRIIVSLDRSANASLQLQAFILARNELANTFNLKDVEEGTTKTGGLYITKSLTNSKESMDTKIFVVTVTNERKKKIAELKKLITTDESN